MNKEEFNLSDILTKDQIKVVLKKHSKRELLGKAVVWELLAGQYKKQLDDLQEDFASMDGIDL